MFISEEMKLTNERILIDGRWYTVDTDSIQIVVQSPRYAYAMFSAWDELFNEPVVLQYVSVNRSKPIPEKPHRIIRPEKEEVSE